MKLFRLFCLVVLVITGSAMLLSSCQQTRDVRFSPSASLVPTIITPFNAYQQAVATWLSEHRQATGSDKRWEVQINAPFECGVGNKKGVLFIHGLGDSPYFFQDVAQRLCDQAVWVRAMCILAPQRPTQYKSVVLRKHKTMKDPSRTLRLQSNFVSRT